MCYAPTLRLFIEKQPYFQANRSMSLSKNPSKMELNSRLDEIFILFFLKTEEFFANFTASGVFTGSNHRIIQQKIDQIYIQNTIVIVPGFADVIPDDDLGE